VSPIDHGYRDCGASFEVGLGSLLSDDYRADCLECDSVRVAADWDAVVRRFGEPPLSDEELKAAVPTAVRRD